MKLPFLEAISGAYLSSLLPLQVTQELINSSMSRTSATEEMTCGMVDRGGLQVVSFCSLTCTCQKKSWCTTKPQANWGAPSPLSSTFEKNISPVLISAVTSIHPVTYTLNWIKQVYKYTVIHQLDYLEEGLAELSAFVGVEK